MTLNEAIVEAVDLVWFQELGYSVLRGPHPALGEPIPSPDGVSGPTPRISAPSSPNLATNSPNLAENRDLDGCLISEQLSLSVVDYL